MYTYSFINVPLTHQGFVIKHEEWNSGFATLYLDLG